MLNLPGASGSHTTPPREFLSPTSIEEAIEMLARWGGEARLIAGGTDLMLDLGKNKLRPRCLVNISAIRGLDQVQVLDNTVEIGAAVTFSTLKDHPYLSQYAHVLADAARSVGSQAIQNVATLVGNIVNAMPAADGALAAIALEAEAYIVDADSAQWIPIERLFLGPGLSAVDSTRQLVAKIRFRRHERGRGTAWRRIGRRPSLTLPILNCAVSLAVKAGRQTIDQAVIVIGPAAPYPLRAHSAEQFLANRPMTTENLAHASRLALATANPRGNVLRASREYRLAMIPIVVEDALRQAVRRGLAQMA
jgi:carbon-monoxide dehydrogenase medium subunit